MVKDKATGGLHCSEHNVFALQTDKITIPLGFEFYDQILSG